MSLVVYVGSSSVRQFVRSLVSLCMSLYFVSSLSMSVFIYLCMLVFSSLFVSFVRYVFIVLFVMYGFGSLVSYSVRADGVGSSLVRYVVRSFLPYVFLPFVSSLCLEWVRSLFMYILMYFVRQVCLY